jgi:hypothetical protein
MSYKGGVYFVLDEFSNAMKIGKADVLEERLSGLQTGNPRILKVSHFIKCKSSAHSNTIEKKLHKFFEHLHMRGEWFEYKKEEFELFFNENVNFETKEKRSPITTSTLFGEETWGIKEFPSCYFYPELTAQILGSYEDVQNWKTQFRTMEWDTNGKQMLLSHSKEVNRVFISDRKHKQNLLQKRFESRKESNRLLEIQESSLEKFLEEA